MAVGIAAASANAMLNAFARGTDYAGNAAVWVKLHTGDPGANGTANAAGETTRQQGTWGAASGGANSNSADIVWTNVSTGETYSHISLWTASSGGTFLGSDDLATPQAVTAGNTFTIPAGSQTMAITPVAA